jgi:hypothetical protein
MVPAYQAATRYTGAKPRKTTHNPEHLRARRLVVQNLVIAATFITGLVIWDLASTLPRPLGVAGHEGSTIIGPQVDVLRPRRDAAPR